VKYTYIVTRSFPHTATQCNTRLTVVVCSHTTPRYNTLQHIATRYHTLQHTAPDNIAYRSHATYNRTHLSRASPTHHTPTHIYANTRAHTHSLTFSSGDKNRTRNSLACLKRRVVDTPLHTVRHMPVHHSCQRTKFTPLSGMKKSSGYTVMASLWRSHVTSKSVMSFIVNVFLMLRTEKKIFCQKAAVSLVSVYVVTEIPRVLRRTTLIFTAIVKGGYEVATISRLLKIIGHFCKRAPYNRLYSAKETCNFMEPTNHSHPVGFWASKSQYTHARTHARTYTHVHTHIRARTCTHTHTIQYDAHCADTQQHCKSSYKYEKYLLK